MSGEPMRFHCAECGLLVRASAFRVEDARLILVCERCGTEAPVRVGGDQAPPRTAPDRLRDRELTREAASPGVPTHPRMAQGASRRVRTEDDAARTEAVTARSEDDAAGSQDGPVRNEAIGVRSEDDAARPRALAAPTELFAMRRATPSAHGPGTAAPTETITARTEAVTDPTEGGSPRPSFAAARTEVPPPRPATAEAALPVVEAPQLRILPGGGLGDPEGPPSEARRAASAAIPAVPEGHCPRCLAIRGSVARGCAGCGLDFLRVSAESLAPSARLAADWSTLQEAWEDATAHQEFLRRATAAGEASGAGRLYRLRLLYRPDDATAARALERMRQQAIATWLTPKAAMREKVQAPRRWQWVFLLLLACALLAALWANLPPPRTP